MANNANKTNKTMKKINRIVLACLSLLPMAAMSSPVFDNERSGSLWLDSKALHDGSAVWKMKKANTVHDEAEKLSVVGYDMQDWMDAVVPGTVLTSLVYNKQVPEPYYGDNNALEKNLIPDITKADAIITLIGFVASSICHRHSRIKSCGFSLTA